MFRGIKLNSEAIILSPVSCRVFRWKKIAISGPSSHVKILFQKFKKKWKNSSNYYFDVCSFKNTIFYLKLFLQISNSWSSQVHNWCGKVLYKFLELSTPFT